MTDDGMLRVKERGTIVADIPNRALTDEAPVYRRPMAEPEYLKEAQQLDLDAARLDRRRGRATATPCCCGSWLADDREQALGLPAVRPHGPHQHD